MRRVAAVVAGLMLVVTACGSSSDDKKAAAPTEARCRSINVKLVDGGCDKPTYDAKAGQDQLRREEHDVARRRSSRSSLPDRSIVAEKDPVEAGVPRRSRSA